MIRKSSFHPVTSNILEQAVANVIKVAAAEETFFSDILQFERDIIQKANTDSANLDQFVSLNDSVNNILGTIAEVQRMTRIKLDCLKELLQKMEVSAENDALEE
jgi:hypothetical protein